jgi:hypothetical protein
MLYILLYSSLSICKYHVHVPVGFSKKLRPVILKIMHCFDHFAKCVKLNAETIHAGSKAEIQNFLAVTTSCLYHG